MMVEFEMMSLKAILRLEKRVTKRMEFLIGLAIGIVGILLALYGMRSPRLVVTCQPVADGDPTVLDCEILNEGRGEAKDVYVSFNGMLPAGTKILAAPEVGAKIVEAETLPDPHATPVAAALLTAFSVHLPRVAGKDRVKFQLRTIDADNLRAAQQVMRIRREIAAILEEFDRRLEAKYPNLADKWNTKLILRGRIKQENFFSPGRISYERGREDIQFFSDEEELTLAHNQDIYRQYKKDFLDVFQGRPNFKAPVVKVKTAEGERTYAIFPPYVKTYVDMPVSMVELRAKGSLVVYPSIPASYE